MAAVAKKRVKHNERMMAALFVVSFVLGQLVTLVQAGARWSVLDWFAGLTVLWWSIRLFFPQKHRYLGRLLPWIFAFAGAAGISVVSRAVRSGGTVNVLDVWYIGRWLMYAGVYAFVVMDTKASAWRIALYVAGVTMAVAGIAQFLFYPDLRNLIYLGWDPHYRRVFGLLFDPNFIGLIYVLTLFVGLALWDRLANRKWWLVCGQVITTMALLLTYSRSSYAAFFVGIAIWFSVRRAFKLLLAVLIVFVTVVFLLSGRGEGQNLFRTTSTLARIGTVRIGWERFVRSPLIGNGFTVPETASMSRMSAPPNRAGTVDTSLLFVLASTGIVGCVPYLFLLGNIGSLGTTSMKRRASPPLLLSSFGAMLVHSLFINSLFYPWVMVWLWILVGVTEREIKVGR